MTFTCVPEESADRLPRPLPPYAPYSLQIPPRPQTPAYWTGACTYDNLVRSRRLGLPTAGAAQRALVAAAAAGT